MSTGTHIGAIILAAGSATRYGALKQVIAIDGEPMVRRIARHALAAGLHPVVVVVGAEGDRVIDCLVNLDVHSVTNTEWSAGMGSSLSTGTLSLMSQSAALNSLMVLLADQPAISLDDLERMLTAHGRAPERILACHHQGNFGPPCIFPLAYADELAALSGVQGARVLLEKYAAVVDGFDLPSAFRDIDTPEDYADWQSMRSKPSPGDLG
ncbi:nucleotidyltransferase family protein [Dyella telluris]|uniref:Nucleotidyltransferase family protein n=1 Tax=Dyella telluris TaxID=2763498 RepID=A0A7G8Q372_9GAMM|nr:nucleotidyltransferase family protein [Dyella telluris]QNK01230.1 nucleotidyltransferase family protein [Dyella telluris]